MTLAQVCEKYVDQPIDFLKIDVEGHEPEVLAGADFSRWRPRIVVVEGELKVSEDVMIGSNYLHATCDGVNHYYVSEEERSLIRVLDQPVSLVLDNFESHELVHERDCHERAYRALQEENRIRLELEARLSSLQPETSTPEATQDLLRDLDARRAELESALSESRREFSELTARHEALRARIAPLIEVRRALRKVQTVLSHPAHQIHRLSANLRQDRQSTESQRN